MEDYAPERMELAPRDIVARAGQTEIDEGTWRYRQEGLRVHGFQSDWRGAHSLRSALCAAFGPRLCGDRSSAIACADSTHRALLNGRYPV